jgi:hypothetical protein
VQTFYLTPEGRATLAIGDSLFLSWSLKSPPPKNPPCPDHTFTWPAERSTFRQRTSLAPRQSVIIPGCVQDATRPFIRSSPYDCARLRGEVKRDGMIWPLGVRNGVRNLEGARRATGRLRTPRGRAQPTRSAYTITWRGQVINNTGFAG